jgi:hypothetical protein
LRLRLLLLSALLASFAVSAQSPTASDTATRPAIVGSLEKGKYSNPMIGFELQLDPACTFADEARAIAWSRQLSQRLNLSLRCGDNLILLSSVPIHADEEVNLTSYADASLQGTMDAGGFKKRGSWQSQTTSGTEVLVQELGRHRDSGKEIGFYYAFMIGRRYVSIIAIGPEANKTELSQATGKLRIEPKPTQ